MVVILESVTPDASSTVVQHWEHLPAGRHFIGDCRAGRIHVAFVRVSTSDQVKDGTSLSQQIDLAMKLAQRNGHDVSALYVDPGKSATRLDFDQRAGVRQLLEDVRAGLIDTLYVYKRDRVARQSGEWLHFVKTCRKHGVSIEFTCSQEPPVGTGVYGRFQEGLMSLWAELEAEQISIRVRDSIMSRFQRGEWVCGTLPFGFIRDEDGEIVQEEHEAAVVREIYRLADIDKWGPARIARYLDETRPRSRRGFPWTRDAVAKVLTSKVYCGYLTMSALADGDRGERVHLETRSPHIPAIIPEDEWMRVQGIRASRRTVAGRPPSPYSETPNVLKGLLVCGECGGHMSVQSQTSKHSRADGQPSIYRAQVYYCRKARQGHCRNVGSVRKEQVEIAVLEACNAQMAGIGTEELTGLADDLHRAQFRELQAAVSSARHDLGSTNSALQRNRVALERAKTPDEARFYQSRIGELLGRRQDQEQHVGHLQRELQQASELAFGRHPVEHLPSAEFISRFYQSSVNLQRSFLSEAVRQVAWNGSDNSLAISFPFPLGA